MTRTRLLIFAKLETLSSKFIFGVVLLALIGAAVYLPFAGQFGYYYDDWYLVYTTHTQGARALTDVFIADRPARAPFMIAMYTLFGNHALWYSLSGYVFRLATALGFMCLLRILWPSKPKYALLAALLSLVYPGFLDQPNAIDYQSHFASLALQIWSITLTGYALRTPRLPNKITLTIFAIITCWLALSLMDYYIGLEGLRLAVVWLLTPRIASLRWTFKIKRVMLRWAPFLAAPVGFLIWHTFFFTSTRPATDLVAQFQRIFTDFLHQGGWVGVYLFQDLLNTLFNAWFIPAYQLAFSARLIDALIALCVAILLAFTGGLLLPPVEESHAKDPVGHWVSEPILTGLWVMVIALVPVLIAGRHITFPTYSRYTLPASFGAVIIISALISSLSSGGLRRGAIALLIGLAAITHTANSQRAVLETSLVRQFWWQVSWRIPQIQPATTLVANYPEELPLPEDYFIWAPANLIYYPHPITSRPVEIILPALILNQKSVNRILVEWHPPYLVVRRGHSVTARYQNILVLSQPTPVSCVQVLDGQRLAVSDKETYDIRLVGVKSKASQIILDVPLNTPPTQIFGSEPDHGWCYFYEKAALYAQQGDWLAVADMGDQAMSSGFFAVDRIEWLPFIDAYARLNQPEVLADIFKRISSDPFTKQEICRTIKIPTGPGSEISPQMMGWIQENYCDQPE
jgi:hypothetical protein